ncbi:MAG: hypothetical protein QXY05_01090 [Candidatus Anstonellales archaeon]
MAHRRRERRGELEKREPDVKQILSQIEKELGLRVPSRREIEEYEIAALTKRIKDATGAISETAYRKGYEDAKKLAALLDKGESKYLNRWG